MTKKGASTAMIPHSPLNELPERSFAWLQSHFERESGIRLRPEKKSLVASRLRKRLEARGLHGFDAYCELLQRPDEEEERQRLLDVLTTHETYFFREPRQHEHFASRALPGFAHRPIRVWSAACSSGEEVWSLAMQLAESLGLRGWELVGSDISTEWLERARQGIYPLERLQNLPERYLHAWCRKGTEQYAGKFIIIKALRDKVAFCQHNLIHPSDAMGSFDVIFLRNALIYFDPPRRSQILQNVAASLRPGGYLYLGESETLSVPPPGLHQVGTAVFRMRSST